MDNTQKKILRLPSKAYKKLKEYIISQEKDKGPFYNAVLALSKNKHDDNNSKETGSLFDTAELMYKALDLSKSEVKMDADTFRVYLRFKTKECISILRSKKTLEKGLNESHAKKEPKTNVKHQLTPEQRNRIAEEAARAKARVAAGRQVSEMRSAVATAPAAKAVEDSIPKPVQSEFKFVTDKCVKPNESGICTGVQHFIRIKVSGASIDWNTHTESSCGEADWVLPCKLDEFSKAMNDGRIINAISNQTTSN